MHFCAQFIEILCPKNGQQRKKFKKTSENSRNECFGESDFYIKDPSDQTPPRIISSLDRVSAPLPPRSRKNNSRVFGTSGVGLSHEANSSLFAFQNLGVIFLTIIIIGSLF